MLQNARSIFTGDLGTHQQYYERARWRWRESEKIVGQVFDREMAACARVFTGNGVSLPRLFLMVQCFPFLFHPLPNDTH
jgi:hypothetical protein